MPFGFSPLVIARKGFSTKTMGCRLGDHPTWTHELYVCFGWKADI